MARLGTKLLLDALSTCGEKERPYRQSQADAAVRFCAKVFGKDYASLLNEAAAAASHSERRPHAPDSPQAATLIEPSRLSTITGECRYSILGGVPYLLSTNLAQSAVYIRSASARDFHT